VARCVARLVDATDGGIKIDGIDIAAMRESKFRPMRRRVQFIFQTRIDRSTRAAPSARRSSRGR
jgi:ABC-type oligopeptide transport system ATPase subunit